MEETPHSVGFWIQQRRHSLRLTQQQLGRLAGCSTAMIRKIEADERRPSPDVAQGLARSLQIPPQQQRAYEAFFRGERSVPLPGLQEQMVDVVHHAPTNLPIPATSLIDREHESAAIQTLLKRDAVRLVTLTGPGGVGKTRLALAAALILRERFMHGTFFVALAPLGDPSQVLSAIARVLEVQETGDRPLLGSLQQHLRHKWLLLVLDNFEQVLAAGLEIAELLQAAPHLKVLVTSREPLHIRGEHEISVPPLLVPDLAQLNDWQALSQYDAVRLFIERAQAVKADFEVTNENAPAVAEICARLEGLPLAIELAAARIRVLPPDTLLQRLASRLHLLTGGAHDLPARHHTLRAAIDWSYDLLLPDDQALFRHLAVFAGGCSLEAAETVLAADESEHTPGTVLDGLHSLVLKSLIAQEESAVYGLRFRMLETLREYAFEQLARSGEAEQIQQRHAAYFLQIAETGSRELLGGQQTAWSQRLDGEHGNLQAALQWAIESDDTDTAIRFGIALARFWWIRGYLREGLSWLEQALARCGPCPPSVRANALYWIGILALHQEDYGRASRSLEESLAIARELDDTERIGYALNALGSVANRQRDPERAQTVYREALLLYQKSGNQERIATVLNNLGFTALLRHDLAQAETMLDESLALARAQQDNHGIAFALNNLGALALQRQRHAEATVLLQESLALFWDIGDRRSSAECLEWMAQLALEQDQPEQATRQLGAAEKLRSAVNAPVPSYQRDTYDALVAAAQAKLGAERFQQAWEHGRSTPDDVVAFATR